MNGIVITLDVKTTSKHFLRHEVLHYNVVRLDTKDRSRLRHLDVIDDQIFLPYKEGVCEWHNGRLCVDVDDMLVTQYW